MIVVAGEALIDLVPVDASAGGDLPALMPRRGGGPYNTAVALGRLGSDVAFCSRLSTDHFGDALLRGLQADRVDTRLIQRGDEPTTLAVAHVSDDGSADYTFYVVGSADRLFRMPDALPPQTRAVSFGTCSLVLEPGASAYEELMRHEAARGTFTVLDPNVRPGLIADADAYRARFHSWLPHVTLLKLSEEDAAWIAQSDDLRTAVKAWLAAGPAAVVLTRGSAGLAVLTREGAEFAESGRRIEVVDTIGAGDTITAALLHRLDTHSALSASGVGNLEAEEWHDVLGFAALTAALTCSRPGAQPPYAAELAAHG
ncbi:carbohydrate kinase [Streptomyces sp. RB6PN25]|uniref:Carbohydrate kinase n=1 Tax=Streptomyces humicola TaxID=2953240 RepID=A0ABT1Q2N0_9ACTN|nr:carbohydrate kinase [Streptomyces humicola]MCQ4083633.1 carbohydrate kinase [Streptomyces humicola]